MPFAFPSESAFAFAGIRTCRQQRAIMPFLSPQISSILSLFSHGRQNGPGLPPGDPMIFFQAPYPKMWNDRMSAVN